MNNVGLYFASVLIWGSTWYVISFQLGTVDPLLSISYRFAIAAALLFAICWVTGRFKQPGFTLKQHGFIAVQAFFLFGLNYWLFYIGTAYLTTGLVCLCFCTVVLMNVFNQAWLFKLPIQMQVVCGGLMGMLGITFVFAPEIKDFSFADDTFKGLMLCLLATLVASFGNMASLRNSRENMPVLMTNAYGMAYGAALCFIIGMALGVKLQFEMSFDYIWSLVYLAVFGSAAAFYCYLTLIRNIGADKASYSAVLFPIVALTISTFFEGYEWTPLAFVGVALILVGNLLAMADLERFKKRFFHPEGL